MAADGELGPFYELLGGLSWANSLTAAASLLITRITGGCVPAAAASAVAAALGCCQLHVRQAFIRGFAVFPNYVNQCCSHLRYRTSLAHTVNERFTRGGQLKKVLVEGLDAWMLWTSPS